MAVLTMASVRLRTGARRSMRFLRSPKGLLLVVFCALLAVAPLRAGADYSFTNVAVAVVVASAIDVGWNLALRRRLILPDGAALTGVIIAFIVRPQETVMTIAVIVAVAMASKELLRTRWSNVFNPAAVGLLFAALAWNTGQSWWGSLPHIGFVGVAAVVIPGAFIVHRLNKAPMLLAFFAVYFGMFTVTSFANASSVAEIFRSPDLQAVVFFGFFMLDDPPTSPVRLEDQLVYGVIVAAASYLVFAIYGGVYFLPAGLLVGNAWESARRLVAGWSRNGAVSLPFALPRVRWPVRPGASVSRGGIVANGFVACVAVVLVLLAGHTMITSASSGAAASAGAEANAPDARPILARFSADVAGTFEQTSDDDVSSLLLDGTTSGDIALNLHLELVSARARGSTPTVNRATLSDPATHDVVCDGRIGASALGDMRVTCSGAGPYDGVTIAFEPKVRADSPSTFKGTMLGSMVRAR